jgi:hypothetical protein
MPNPNLTMVTCVLDRSASMASIQKATEDGINEFIQGQKSGPGECRIRLVQFDHQYDLVFDCRAQEAPYYHLEPRGNTALRDAVGRTIVELGRDLKELPEEQRPGKVVVTVSTDGAENASQIYTPEQVGNLINLQRSVYKWEFLFFGANQDSFTSAKEIGISDAAKVMNFAANNVAVRSSYAAMSSNVNSYRVSGSSASLDWNTAQREAALQDDKDVNRQK